MTLNQLADWVNEDNMVGDYFHPTEFGELVMSFHIAEVNGKKLFAVARWWYRNCIPVAVFDEKDMLWKD